jgi:hypothetical protein
LPPPEPRVPTATSDRLAPFQIFQVCIGRARNLLDLHKAAHGKKSRPPRELADAHRAAITLAISALDAYVRTAVTLRVRDLLASTGPLPKPLSERLKQLISHDDAIDAARKGDFLDRVERALRNEFATESFQGVNQITKAMWLVGIDRVLHEVASAADMNADALHRDLERFTKRRHAIAHQGDYDLNQNPPRENPITKKDAEDCIRVIVLIAKHIEELK